jgi:chromate transporter
MNSASGSINREINHGHATRSIFGRSRVIVGVVLNLAVWFGLHVIFPGDGTINSFAILVGIVAFIGMVRWKWDIVPVVLCAGFVGVVFKIFLSYYH